MKGKNGKGLNKAGNELAISDVADAAVDIFAYTPTSLTYPYSIDNGLVFGGSIAFAAAFSPSNEQ